MTDILHRLINDRCKHNINAFISYWTAVYNACLQLMWQELKSNDPKIPNIFDLAVFDVEKIVKK